MLSFALLKVLKGLRQKHYEENTTMKTRNGKHRIGKVRMGVYVEPFRKAVALLAAKECDMTMTDVIWAGVESIAKGRGILDGEGRVTRKFKNQYDATLAIVEQAEVNG